MFMTYPLMVGLAIGIWESRHDALIAARQLTTTGVVTAYDRENHNQCSYVFSVQGKPFTGRSSAPHGSATLGEIVTVYYDSTDPSTSGLEDYSVKGRRDGGLIPIYVFGIFLIPGIIIYAKAKKP